MEDYEEVQRPILRMKRPKNKQTKTVLIFDVTARKEYLTGFQKRKNQRRKQAKLEHEKKIKDEKLALKQKVREMLQKSDRHRLPEVEEFLKSTVYELPEHTVTITDMSDRLTATAQPEPSSDEQDMEQQPEDGEEEDSDALKRKRKKLINKLAQVGNNPSSRKKKMKRLAKAKFRGGGGGGGKSSTGGGRGGGKSSTGGGRGGGKSSAGAGRGGGKSSAGGGRGNSSGGSGSGKKSWKNKSGSKKQKHQ